MGKYVKVRDRYGMKPTPAQMNLIRKYIPDARFEDCFIAFEGGSFSCEPLKKGDWFCVHIFRKGKYYCRVGKYFGKDYHKYFN